MKELWLDVYGVLVNIEGSEKVLQDLAQDFRYFLKSHTVQSVDIKLEVHHRESPQFQVRHHFFNTKMCKVYGFGANRVCDCSSNAAVFISHKKRQRIFKVFSSKSEELYELSYTAALSAIGEALDAKGYHRAHAMGIDWKGHCGIVVLPHGGGKSALSVLLSRVDGVRVFSDENPLFHKGMIYPYPIRMALTPNVADALGVSQDSRRLFRRKIYPTKVLIPIEAEKIATIQKITFLISGVVSSERDAVPMIHRTSRFFIFCSLLKSMVVGIGLAQMSEYMLRTDAVFKIFKNAISRLVEAIWLSTHVDCYKFHLSQNAFQNEKVLNEFLSANYR